jgi:Apea-like HEPN
MVAAGHLLPPREERPGWRWEARGDDQFFYRPLESAGSVLPIRLEVDRRYHGTPDHRKCIEALAQHPTIGPRLNTLVGSLVSSRRLEADEIPDRLVWRQLEHQSFNESVFSEFDELYAWLTRKRESYIVIAPLSGLALEAGPIRLRPGTELDRMSDEEVIGCLQFRLIQSMGSVDFVRVPLRFAVRIREEVPIVVGDADLSVEEATVFTQRWASRVESVIDALRLFKPGLVSVPGIVYFPDGGLDGRMYSALPSPAPSPLPSYMRGEGYRLTVSDEAPFPDLWRALGSRRVTGHKPLATALRRFSLAGGRSSPEDQIIDLMIAAEALFLPGEAQESAHKLSLRSAALLSDVEPLCDVFRHMKRAYNARSKLAHGGETGPMKWADGSPATLADYVERVSRYMRLAVQRLARSAANREALATSDWDIFVLKRLR